MAGMKKKQRRDELFTTLGVKDRLKEYPALAKWATAYVSAAEEAGEDVELGRVFKIHE